MVNTMEERAWFSYAFFVIGIEFIYWNMKWSGVNHPQNPAWAIVSWIHVVAIGGVIAIILLWSLLYVDYLRSIKKEKVDKPKENIEEENNSDLKKITEQIEVEKQKRIEEQQKLEEQRKQEAIKRRRERSANAAAHDALDDFL